MSYTSDDDDEPNSSEFGSGDEEVECGLYAQLYFEPNPDVTIVNTTSKGLTEIQSKANVFHKTYEKVDEKYLVDIAGKSKDELAEENNVKECQLDREINTQNPTSQCFGSQDHTSTYIDLENDSNCSPKTNSKTSDVRTSTLIDKNKEIQEICVQKPDSTHRPSTSSDVCTTSNKVRTLPTRREKLSSICSEGSIPGSIPLDGLYCNMVTSDEEIQEDIGNKLAIIDVKALRQKNEDETQNASRKRKRDCGTDSSENEEESRCNSLGSTVSKNTRIAESTNCTLKDESDSESDCVISQPSSKHPLIFTIDSSSDNELVLTEKGKKRSANETQVREDNSALPAKRTCTGKPRSADESSESLKKPNRITITEDNKKKKFRADVYTNSKPDDLIIRESDTESDSDSCLTKGTDLTLNVDEQLSVWIKKLTKGGTSDTSGHASIIKKKHNVPGVCHSVDFTVNQSDKQPTCDRWMQEMVDFYDDDGPEDLKVEAIHEKQSSK